MLYVMVFALNDESQYVLHFVESSDEVQRFTNYMREEFMEEQYLILGPIDEGRESFMERVSQQFPKTIEV